MDYIFQTRPILAEHVVYWRKVDHISIHDKFLRCIVNCFMALPPLEKPGLPSREIHSSIVSTSKDIQFLSMKALRNVSCLFRTHLVRQSPLQGQRKDFGAVSF